MVDIPQVTGEKENLALHVDMCTLRYRQIIRGLYILTFLILAARVSQADALALVLKLMGVS